MEGDFVTKFHGKNPWESLQFARLFVGKIPECLILVAITGVAIRFAHGPEQLELPLAIPLCSFDSFPLNIILKDRPEGGLLK